MEKTYNQGDKTQESKIQELTKKINQSKDPEEIESFITEIRKIEASISLEAGEKIGYRKGRASTIVFD